MDIVIASYANFPKVLRKLEKLGYFHEGNLGIADREAFAQADEYVPYTKVRKMKAKHHLYVCVQNSLELKRHITFRNALRSHPHLINEYSRLKKELAINYNADRQAYTNGKTSFVNSVLNMYSSLS